ncbi:MAG TPA: iron-containing alcohol dehydrogenase, partial [Bryobacteraceae bacterium]|nr:iron-containing alcohol dehydrogenase [Bryobacteraceae bacterium]
RAAVVDPELTLDLPREVTASTGLDALTQLIEPYISVRANALTDMFCTEGMQRVRRSLRSVFRDGHDADARNDMSFAALLGGLALANAGLGVVHGFAAPVGGMYPAPHGSVCAAILPHGFEVNLRAVRNRAPERLERFATVARVLTGRDDAEPEHAVEWLLELCSDLEIPGLAHWGVTDSPELVDKAARANSMNANPVVLSGEELAAVLHASL